MSRQQTDNTGIPSRRSGVSGKPKQNKALKVFGVIAAVIIGILVIIAVTLIVLMYKGEKDALGANRAAMGGIVVPAETNASVETDPEDTNTYIYYNDKKYMYNDKITTILFAGIDTHEEQQTGKLGGYGQADCIIVCALDTESGNYKMMAVSRDSMVDVDEYDASGNYSRTVKEQICLAHGYVDGKEGSCENLKRSVSRLLFGIPVNSYAVIDLDALGILNNDVGGVHVTVNEDLTSRDPSLYEGADLVLDAKQAEAFVRYREMYGDGTMNDRRMERQKIYLEEFIKQTLALTKKDITTPVRMYNDAKDYMTTDIDVSRVTYYASVFLKSGFSADKNFIKVPGEASLGDKGYAEYHVDNKALFDMILDTYYIEVE